MRIVINFIPHNSQRYDTAGDWYHGGEKEDDLIIMVSRLPSRREMMLVAIHELVEAVLCESNGITEANVDAFDMTWDPKHHEGEPGDHKDSPYYFEHQIATGIERILAAELGVSWSDYSLHVEELEWNPK